MTDTLTLSNAKLMQSLSFNEADLAANREGHLSAAQKERLRTMRRRLALINGAIIFAAIIAATLLLFLGLRNRSAILIVIGIGITLCNAALCGLLVRGYLRLSADLHAETVQRLQGTAAHTVRLIMRQVAVYIVRIGETELIVDKAVFESFATDAAYNVYRAPHSGELLTAEAVL